MTVAITVELFGRDHLPNLREAWLDLAGRCLEPTVFNDPGFLLAAARHLAPAPGPRFITLWTGAPNGGAMLVGLCPIATSWLPGLPAVVWTHPQATAAFPLLDRRHAAPALAALLATVRHLPGRPAALLLAGVATDGPTAVLLRESGHPTELLDERTRAVLRRGGAEADLSAKARKELRRQWNRLAAQGPLEFRSAAANAPFDASLDQFLTLERQGWKGARGTALASNAGTLRFAREALRDLAARGLARIDSLETGDRIFAGGVVLRAGDRAFFWKTAYDEALAASSPGLQLALQITAAQRAEPDLAFTDSCAVPGHSMIDRIWPDRIIVADALVGTHPGASTGFRIACAIERQRRGVRASAKRLLARASSLPRRSRRVAGTAP